MSRRSRPLDREQVVRVGLELLDEVGLDALTMRKLAARLDVQLNTVYWHTAGKPQLLEAMADLMLADCIDEPLSSIGRARVCELAHRYRRAMLIHRDGARVMAGTYPGEPRTLRFADMLVASLLDVGIEPREAAWTAWTVVYYTLGLTQEQQAAPEIGGHLATVIRAGHYPALIATEPWFAPGDFDERFAFGLNLMVGSTVGRVSE